MKGYQMAKKKEPEFIGRHGEVIQNVKIKGFCDNNGKRVPEKKADHVLITGIGKDMKGRKANVRFTVLKESHIKDGMYEITRELPPSESGLSFTSDYREDLRYLNGRLHGKEQVWVCAGPMASHTLKTTYWQRGKECPRLPATWRFLGMRGSETAYIKEKQAKSAHDIRKLLEDASVVKAIKTGDPVKVRNAATRVAMKATMKRVREEELE